MADRNKTSEPMNIQNSRLLNSSSFAICGIFLYRAISKASEGVQ